MKPCRVAEPPHGLRAVVLLVGAFLFMGLVTRLLCQDANGYSSFWPPNGALVVALLTLPLPLAAPTVAACVGLNLLLNLLSALSVAEGLLACALNVLVSVLTAVLARRFCGALTDLARFHRLIVFTGIACVATGIEAALGVAVERLAFGDPSPLLSDWAQWVLCDTLGLLLATPPLLLAVRRRPASEAGTARPPVALLVLIMAVTLFSVLLPDTPLFLLIFPLVVLLAFQAQPAWVLSALLFVSLLLSAATVHDVGPIAHLSPLGPRMRSTMLQPFLVALLLSALPASNASGEKLRTNRRLARIGSTLEHAANHDQLTGLMTRSLFKRRLAGCIRDEAGGALFLVDLDRFKQINDTHGHLAGDEVLRVFGQRLAAYAAGAGRCAARLGGDEFAVLLPGMRDAAALQTACHELLVVARMPCRIDGMVVVPSASIGATPVRPSGEDPDQPLRRADIALYAAKHAGRDTFGICDDAENRAIVPPATVAARSARGVDHDTARGPGRDGRVIWPERDRSGSME